MEGEQLEEQPGAAAASEAQVALLPTLPYGATVGTAPPKPTEEDLRVAEARKTILRIIDTRITREDEASALTALCLSLKLVSNVLDNPTEPKYQRFKAANKTISKQLLHHPGGPELLRASGFHTQVHQMEEFWVADASEYGLRVLGEARQGLVQYEELLATRVAKLEAARRERAAGMTQDRLQTLAEIEADKAERKDRSWK